MNFQLIALILTLVWLLIVITRFRRSRIALLAGLSVIGAYTVTGLILGKTTFKELGLDIPDSWLLTIISTLVALGITIVYSPLADRLATRWVKQPPTLESFRALQRSKLNLIVGIIIAWLLGGILEEIIARGIVLSGIKTLLTIVTFEPIAAGIAICIAGLGAGLMHFYQGTRAVIITTQISILFGILFVVTGYNLWAVIICHGLYDTIAFIRFAAKKSKYSR